MVWGKNMTPAAWGAQCVICLLLFLWEVEKLFSEVQIMQVGNGSASLWSLLVQFRCCWRLYSDNYNCWQRKVQTPFIAWTSISYVSVFLTYGYFFSYNILTYSLVSLSNDSRYHSQCLTHYAFVTWWLHFFFPLSKAQLVRVIACCE